MTEPVVDATQPTPPAPPRTKYKVTVAHGLDANLLSTELSAVFKKPVRATFITPGQKGPDGTLLEPTLWVVDSTTGEDIVTTQTEIDKVLSAHKKPADPVPTKDKQAAAKTKVSAATTLDRLKAGVLEFMDTF